MNDALASTQALDGETSTGTPPADLLMIRPPSDNPIPLGEKLFRALTSPIRLLPDFLLIGTQKGGTSSLYTYLQAHPAIASAVRKEVHFFDRSSNWSKGRLWYQGHFPTRVDQYYAHHLRRQPLLTGEATPEYLFLPHIPHRVAKLLPQVKLLVLLRNPVDRAYSQYQHAVAQGYETRSFEEAINYQEASLAQDRVQMPQDVSYERYTYMQHWYLLRSLYLEQLQRWMSLFPREQFLILQSEAFYADPVVTLKQVFDFLNLPASELQLRKGEYKVYNKNCYAKMDPGLRKRLLAFFAPYNARLYDFLGVDFGWNQ